jgi:hypothetical protein
MIKYAGVPQLGDYVIINDDDNDYVRLVTSVIENINQPITYHLGYGAADWPIEELTRVKSNWIVGELVRYNGKVYKVKDIKLNTGKFVYTIDNQVVPEDKLEYPNDISQRFKYGMKVKVNDFVEEDMWRWRGVLGTIDFFTCAIIHFIPDCGYNACSMNWEAIDIVEEKVEPYNAELICVKGEGAWKEGELAKVIDNHFYFIDRTGSMCCDEEKVYNLNDVNDLFSTVRFAEIKETIGDKPGWNGKFYVVDTTANGALEVGNVYTVKDGILNDGGYNYVHIFTSFEEIQKRFSYLTLIEVKE